MRGEKKDILGLLPDGIRGTGKCFLKCGRYVETKRTDTAALISSYTQIKSQ